MESRTLLIVTSPVKLVAGAICTCRQPGVISKKVIKKLKLDLIVNCAERLICERDHSEFTLPMLIMFIPTIFSR